MNWLRARIQGWRPFRKETIAEQAGAESKTSDSPRARLMFLVRDASGPVSYRLHTFDDAQSAAAFVQFWFPPRFEHGIHAFWATDDEPEWRADSKEERPAEVLVLIRDLARHGVVYPFSCSDMGQALSWATREAARSLDLSRVLMYWAVPAQISTDRRGRVHVTPSEPPAFRPAEGGVTPVLADLPRSTVRGEETETADQRDAIGSERTEQPSEAGQTNEASDALASAARDGAEDQEAAAALREVYRLLNRSGRERRNGPFQGFGSPPGRF